MDKYEQMGRDAYAAGAVRVGPVDTLLAEGGLPAVDAWYVGYDAARGVVFVPRTGW